MASKEFISDYIGSGPVTRHRPPIGSMDPLIEQYSPVGPGDYRIGVRALKESKESYLGQFAKFGENWAAKAVKAMESLLLDESKTKKTEEHPDVVPCLASQVESDEVSSDGAGRTLFIIRVEVVLNEAKSEATTRLLWAIREKGKEDDLHTTEYGWPL